MHPDAGLSALEQKFPRILNAITLIWGHGDLDPVFERLLIDNRGNRQGFPSEVMAELLMLDTLSKSVHKPSMPLDARYHW